MKIPMSDSTGRTPNLTQIAAITFLNEAWAGGSVIGLNLSVGAGKSFIARAVQLAVPGAVILTPTNQLVSQYCETYPELKKCIGKTHYKDSAEQDANFALAAAGKPSIFNPASFWHKTVKNRQFQPSVIILDEADACYSMLQGFSDRTIQINKKQTSISLLSIMKSKLESALQVYSRNSERKQNITRYHSARYWYHAILENEHLYSHAIEQHKTPRRTLYKLVIQSLLIQSHVQKRFFGSAKVILMSATLLPSDIKAITGRELSTQFKSFDSPIPVENRKVYAGNVLPVAPNHQSDFNVYTAAVRSTIDSLKHLGNGMVHSTYSESRVWGDLWGDALVHTKANKAQMLSYFKRNGGVLLGSGMSEGVDLPGDLCRYNVLPKCHYPNMGDSLVQKRKALEDGEHWYNLETLRHTMQAVGRSTRNPKDWSVTVILDPRFAYLFNRYYKSIPMWFKESVELGRVDILKLPQPVIR